MPTPTGPTCTPITAALAAVAIRPRATTDASKVFMDLSMVTGEKSAGGRFRSRSHILRQFLSGAAAITGELQNHRSHDAQSRHNDEWPVQAIDAHRRRGLISR